MHKPFIWEASATTVSLTTRAPTLTYLNVLKFTKVPPLRRIIHQNLPRKTRNKFRFLISVQHGFPTFMTCFPRRSAAPRTMMAMLWFRLPRHLSPLSSISLAGFSMQISNRTAQATILKRSPTLTTRNVVPIGRVSGPIRPHQADRPRWKATLGLTACGRSTHPRGLPSDPNPVLTSLQKWSGSNSWNEWSRLMLSSSSSGSSLFSFSDSDIEYLKRSAGSFSNRSSNSKRQKMWS